jgi:hypothetical protein
MPTAGAGARTQVVGSMVVVVAVLLALLVGSAREHSPEDSGRQRSAPGGAPASSPSASPGRVLGPASGGTAAAIVMPAGPPGTIVRYDFEQSSEGIFHDAAGQLPLHLDSVNGGAIGAVTHGAGHAVQYPAPCRHYGAPQCPRAVLTSADADVLNPGAKPIRYGATVLIAADATSEGQNVLQKGYSTTGVSQFKLQIDGEAGQPSCVFVGLGASRIYVALSTVSVADGNWHRVACIRSGDAVAVQVDSVVTGYVSIPASLSVSNDAPLRLGGNGSGPNNDQYNGALDDVYVEIYG